MMAIVSLDIALWSIKCQVLSVLLRTLIGGSVRDKASAYALIRDYSKDPSYLRRPGVTSLHKAQTHQLVSTWGNRWLAGMRTNLAFVEAVREAVGLNIDIMVDR